MTPVPTSYAEYKFYLDIGVLLAVACNSGYTWWSNREKVTSQRFALLEKEVAERLKKSDLDTSNINRDSLCVKHKADRDKQCEEHKTITKDLHAAYDALHTEVNRLPDRREITNLDNSIKSLTRELGVLDGRIGGINRVADLMNEFLINQGGK
ncbi:MAG: hypothetical protein WA003_08685 [Desulfuromonadaceae bacterium]